jgi:hypothetical protein
VVDVQATVFTSLVAHDQLVLLPVDPKALRMTRHVAAQSPADQLALYIAARDALHRFEVT